MQGTTTYKERRHVTPGKEKGATLSKVPERKV